MALRIIIQIGDKWEHFLYQISLDIFLMQQKKKLYKFAIPSCECHGPTLLTLVDGGC